MKLKLAFFLVLFHLSVLTMCYYCFKAENDPNNLYNCQVNKVV